MIKTITETVVDGYATAETDFATRLAQSDPQVQADFESQIIQPLLAVLGSPDQAAVLTITGHADRVDTDGLTREQRRQQEFDASNSRASSANLAIQQIIRDRLLRFVPDDFETIPQLAFLPRAAGAAILRQGAGSLTEAERLQNRRVQFRVVRFQPS